jgi:hypothetical protein
LTTVLTTVLTTIAIGDRPHFAWFSSESMPAHARDLVDRALVTIEQLV